MFDNENSSSTPADFTVSDADIPADAPVDAVSDAPADSSPAPVDEGGYAPDFDKMFGLEPEPKETQDPTDATPQAADPPEAPREGDTQEDAKTDQATEAEPNTPAAEAATDAKEDQSYGFNDKLNWDDEKVPFREEFKNLKNAYLDLARNSVEGQYLESPEKFVDWMRETSPDSFTAVGAKIATESADLHPAQWADYLLSKNPDLIAEKISGREGMTLERLKAELAILTEDDDPDVQARMEKDRQGADTKQQETAPETPEQKRIRELLEREEVREREALQQTVHTEVFAPIEKTVNSLVSQAGLDVDPAELEGKDFAQLGPEQQEKVFVNTMIPMWIDQRVKMNPQWQALQGRLEYFLSDKDERGNPKKPDIVSAKKLQHQASIIAQNCTNEVLALFTNRRAKLSKDATTPPTPKPPQPQVRSAGALPGSLGSSNGNDDDAALLPAGKIDWSGAMP
jgi:hypothetical protein